MYVMKCELCERDGGELLWRDTRCRVVHVDEPGYPGFCRVIWGAHVREMTDLSAADSAHLMRVVFAVEQVLRELFRPEKINLASLGNVTPHLHWHVIPRSREDPHFPNPVWGERVRAPSAAESPQSPAALRRALAGRLSRLYRRARKSAL
jgi:diadenosine tetraphosphate (Ap4A) HIT family hydrolase